MPVHGIPHVTAAHPTQWKWVDESRRAAIQGTWEQFLRNNPRHRPGQAPGVSDRPCIVHNLAGGLPRERCIRQCLTPALYQELGSYLDHEEPWHYADDAGIMQPVLFGHPYLPIEEHGKRLKAFLRALPDRAGEKLAIYVSTDEEGWYAVPTTGMLIQNRMTTPIKDWQKITI